MPADFVAVAATVDELVLEVAVAVVNEVVVEAAAVDVATVPVPVVVAAAALGPANLVQKPNASLLFAVSSGKRYG